MKEIDFNDPRERNKITIGGRNSSHSNFKNDKMGDDFLYYMGTGAHIGKETGNAIGEVIGNVAGTILGVVVETIDKGNKDACKRHGQTAGKYIGSATGAIFGGAVGAGVHITKTVYKKIFK